MKTKIAVLFLAIITTGFIIKSDQEEYFYIPKNFPKPIYDFSKNTISKDKIELGRALFYDPILSSKNTISCASCHSQYNSFAHADHKLSHGIDDKIGFRNAPTLQNMAWQKNFGWDGSVHHLDAQALSPISNPIEMNESLSNVILKLQNSKKYSKLFYKAFNDSIITGERTLKSISQFMLTLISANSKYDKVVRKEKGISFTENEQKGYKLFQKHCNSCHQEPLFTNNKFENNGLKPDSVLNDVGRMKVTQNKTDEYRFKTPTLRNIEVSYPYMHDGRYPNLQMVLFHYTSNIHKTKTLSKILLKPIPLSETEKGNIIDFLKTLTDEEFLRNKKHSFPRNTN